MGLKALLYADLQATDGHERCFNQPDLPLQIFRVRKFFAALLGIFTKYKCDCLWDVGDTTDDRSYLPMPAIDAVIEGLEPFPEHELNLKLIGNHEQYLRDTSVHIGRLFQAKFTVIAQTEVFEVADTLIACAGYPASDAALADWLSKTAYAYRNYERRVLLGHFQVVGCQLNSGQALLGVPREAVEKYSLALLGHVHKPQQVGRNAFYVGSPFQQNFGEKNEQKRVGILDLETLELTWVPLPGFPEYRVVDFDRWLKLVKKEEEHRYQVVIRDPKQAEQFYKHPLMSYAEPIYNYELDDRTKAEIAQQQSFTREDVMKRWVKHKPPGAYGIQASEEEVLEVGNLLSGA